MPFPSYTQDKAIQKLQAFFDDIFDDPDSDNAMIELRGGMGAGKTTILRRIADEARLSRKFTRVVTVLVPQSGNLKKIFRDMSVQLNDFGERSIPQVLARGNFLLLFDNVVEPLDFKKMGIHFPLGNYKTIAVFATRKRLGLGNLVKVSPLSPGEDLDFFLGQFQATHPVFADAKLMELASQMTRFCDGLPMALNVLAGALRENSSVKKWQEAYKRLDDAASMNKDSYEFFQVLPILEDRSQYCQPYIIFDILKIGFDYLPSLVEKECLRFMALFPEHYFLSESVLIEYWIGEGYLSHGCGNAGEAVKRGKNIIQLLTGRNMLEEGTYWPQMSMKTVKMHHTLRDLFLLGRFQEFDGMLVSEDVKSGKAMRDKASPSYLGKAAIMYDTVCDFFLQSYFKNFGRMLARQDLKSMLDKWRHAKMAIVGYEISDMELNQLPWCPNLQTLILTPNSQITSLPMRFSDIFPLLRVLDLANTGIHVLPPSFGNLKRLEYLDISSTNIESLPSELGLRKLKCLKLSRTHSLTAVPLGFISKLVKLQLFEMIKLSPVLIKRIFDEFLQVLTCLEHLGIIKISLHTFHLVDKLMKIERLASSVTYLEITFVENLSLEFLQVFRSMSNLQDLAICYSSCLEKITLHGQQDQGINATLQGLSIRNCPELRSLDVEWGGLQFLQNLGELEIRSCPKLRSICWVRYLPSLTELRIEKNEMIENLSSERLEGGNDSFFPKLRVLTLKNLKLLCCIGDLSRFLSLEFLNVYECPMLKTIYYSGVLPNIREISGEVDWCNIQMDETLKTLSGSFRVRV